jgi:hypothetical protein
MAATLRSETIQIPRPTEEVLAVLTDFESYPDWAAAFSEARVLERGDDGRGSHVAFAIDMTIRTVRYTLAYQFDLPGKFSWKMTEGDLTSIEGSYELASVDDGTRCTCHQAVETGFWIPGPLRRIAEGSALRNSLEELSAEVLRRSQSQDR